MFSACLVIFHSSDLFLNLSNVNKIDFVMVAGSGLDLLYYFVCPIAISMFNHHKQFVKSVQS